MVRYCLCNLQINSKVYIERNPAYLTREGSSMVKKLSWATSWVVWARFVGYNSDKNTLVILPVTHTTDHKAIQVGSWNVYHMKWLCSEIILINEIKT